MLLTDPKVERLRESFNAWQRRQERAHVQRTGNFNGASRAGKPYRFAMFLNRLESYERSALRFMVHAVRVELALTSVTFEQEAA